MQAHGTGTPQNRTTESRMLDAVARGYGIRDWPVAAIKCYVGHTMAAAGGDQLVSSIGVFEHGILPGISTIDAVAPDVVHERLRISSRPQQRDPADWEVAFLNARGFGGNNATAGIVSRRVAERWLTARHGAAAITDWRSRNEAVAAAADAWDRAMTAGTAPITYLVDNGVRSEEHVRVEGDVMYIEGLPPISLVD